MINCHHSGPILLSQEHFMAKDMCACTYANLPLLAPVGGDVVLVGIGAVGGRYTHTHSDWLLAVLQYCMHYIIIDKGSKNVSHKNK